MSVNRRRRRFFSEIGMTTLIHNVSDAIKSSPRSVRNSATARVTFVYGPTVKVRVSHDMTKEEVFAEIANTIALPARITLLADPDGAEYDGRAKYFGGRWHRNSRGRNPPHA